jgi:hypothetical protein
MSRRNDVITDDVCMPFVRTGVAALALLASLNSGSSAAAPSASSAPSIRKPPVAGVFDYQIGGSYRPAKAVAIVDRDRSSHPVPGVYNICYVNAFQTQPNEKQFWLKHHSQLLLRSNGHYLRDPGWPGEFLLDTSTDAHRRAIAAIIGRWIDGCADKGFDAIEPDNLDSWTRHGARDLLTRADNFALAKLLVRRAHDDGLAIAQKNAAESSHDARTQVGFDFAIAEECSVYHECSEYLAAYGRHVIEIEYTDNPHSAYTRACDKDGGKISIILRDRDVTPRGSRHYRYEHC